MAKPRLYFGHPVNTYHTELEADLIMLVRIFFTGWDIENPNQPKHQEGYQRVKTATGNGMSYFYDEVLPGCQGGVFLPFPEGKWGAGVYGEARFLAGDSKPVYRINLCDGILRGITRIEYLRGESVLTVPETRERTKLPFYA